MLGTIDMFSALVCVVVVALIAFCIGLWAGRPATPDENQLQAAANAAATDMLNRAWQRVAGETARNAAERQANDARAHDLSIREHRCAAREAEVEAQKLASSGPNSVRDEIRAMNNRNARDIAMNRALGAHGGGLSGPHPRDASIDPILLGIATGVSIGPLMTPGLPDLRRDVLETNRREAEFCRPEDVSSPSDTSSSSSTD